MQNPGLRCAESPHNMFLSSSMQDISPPKAFLCLVVKDFIQKRRVDSNSHPRMQVYQNQISITYESPAGTRKDSTFNLQDFKVFMDELAKKMKLYKMNSLESFSINLLG